jgi:hypothetical protein
VCDALNQPFTFVDTELSEGIQRHSLIAMLGAVMSRQRRPDGEPLPNLLCALLVWPLMKVKSLHCFCAELCQILAGQVSVLYDFLGREDINWRGLSSELARRVYQDNEIGVRSQRAFVVDDTSKARAGRKVQGTSCYYDHTEGRTRKGHQVLQLGLAGEKGFLPVEAQIVMGKRCDPQTQRQTVPRPAQFGRAGSAPGSGADQTPTVPGHAPTGFAGGL